MSRAKALRQLSLDDFRTSMGGIYSEPLNGSAELASCFCVIYIIIKA